VGKTQKGNRGKQETNQKDVFSSKRWDKKTEESLLAEQKKEGKHQSESKPLGPVKGARLVDGRVAESFRSYLWVGGDVDREKTKGGPRK